MSRTIPQSHQAEERSPVYYILKSITRSFLHLPSIHESLVDSDVGPPLLPSASRTGDLFDVFAQPSANAALPCEKAVVG